MATSDVQNASIPQLISGVVGDVKDMAMGHATKARSEIKDEFNGLKRYLMKLGIALGLGVLGGILLSHAFALGLDAVGLPQWSAYLISAALFVGIGAIVLKRLPADKSDIDLVPDNALSDMKRDAQNLKEDVKNGVTDPSPAPAR